MDPSFCPNCHGDKLSSQRLCEACTPSFAPSFSVDLGGSGSNHHHLRHSAAGASASNSNIDSLMTDDGETSLMFHQQPVVRSAGGVAVMHAASVGTGLGLGGGFGGSGIASTSSLLAPSLAPPRAVAPMKQKRAPGSHADRRRTASGMAPSLTAGAHLMTVPTAAAPAAATKSHTAAAVAAAATSYNHALKPATTAPAWDVLAPKLETTRCPSYHPSKHTHNHTKFESNSPPHIVLREIATALRDQADVQVECDRKNRPMHRLLVRVRFRPRALVFRVGMFAKKDVAREWVVAFHRVHGDEAEFVGMFYQLRQDKLSHVDKHAMDLDIDMTSVSRQPSPADWGFPAKRHPVHLVVPKAVTAAVSSTSSSKSLTAAKPTESRKPKPAAVPVASRVDGVGAQAEEVEAVAKLLANTSESPARVAAAASWLARCAQTPSGRQLIASRPEALRACLALCAACKSQTEALQPALATLRQLLLDNDTRRVAHGIGHSHVEALKRLDDASLFGVGATELARAVVAQLTPSATTAAR